MSKIDSTGDLHVSGRITCGSMTLPSATVSNANVTSDAAITRAKLALESLAIYPVTLESLRVHDAFQTTLPGTSASDDLGVYGNTFGTTSPTVKTYDVKALGALSIRARCVLSLPPEYEAAATVNFRVRAGMVTTIADVSCTVDVEAYRLDEDGAVGLDLCATAAQAINSLTKANKDFTITATTLGPSDRLDVRVTVAVNDAATATAVIAELSRLALMCDIRG